MSRHLRNSSWLCRRLGLRHRTRLSGTYTAWWTANTPATLLLPPCRVTFKSTRLAWERSTACCQRSGCKPARWASCTASSAHARSRASAMCSLGADQRGGDGGPRVGIRLQRREQGCPHAQPLGCHQQVDLRPAVQLALELAEQLEARPC